MTFSIDDKAHSDVEGRTGMISSYRRIIKRGYQKPSELTVEEFKALSYVMHQVN